MALRYFHATKAVAYRLQTTLRKGSERAVGVSLRSMPAEDRLTAIVAGYGQQERHASTHQKTKFMRACKPAALRLNALLLFRWRLGYLRLLHVSLRVSLGCRTEERSRSTLCFAWLRSASAADLSPSRKRALDKLSSSYPHSINNSSTWSQSAFPSRRLALRSCSALRVSKSAEDRLNAHCSCAQTATGNLGQSKRQKTIALDTRSFRLKEPAERAATLACFAPPPRRPQTPASRVSLRPCMPAQTKRQNTFALPQGALTPHTPTMWVKLGGSWGGLGAQSVSPPHSRKAAHGRLRQHNPAIEVSNVIPA